VGHYKAVHEWEKFKPSETLWIAAEAFDDLAKSNYERIKKGKAVQGSGYIVQNRWVDKITGEEKKMYKVRFTNFLSPEKFAALQNALAEIPDIGPDDRSHFSSDIESQVPKPWESVTSIPVRKSAKYPAGSGVLVNKRKVEATDNSLQSQPSVKEATTGSATVRAPASSKASASVAWAQAIANARTNINANANAPDPGSLSQKKPSPSLSPQTTTNRPGKNDAVHEYIAPIGVDEGMDDLSPTWENIESRLLAGKDSTCDGDGAPWWDAE
jgi:single-stranded DNA-binding protein